MNKREIIKEIRDVVEGRSGYQYISVAKKTEGKGWEITGGGLGWPVMENFGAEDMIFRHDRNSCTLHEAECELDARIWGIEPWEAEKVILKK